MKWHEAKQKLELCILKKLPGKKGTGPVVSAMMAWENEWKGKISCNRPSVDF